MDGSSQATEESPATVGSGSAKLKGGTLNDDQCFLLYFIMGTYLGPDIKGERKQKSVLQRIAEGLPPYTSDQLTNSFMRTVELEHIYYYVLKKADKSVIVKLTLLCQFFQGNISCLAHNSAARYPQFADLFPPELHPQSLSKNRSKIIENIVFINNPETSYINPDDIERFKRLSRVEDFHLNKCPVRSHTSLDGSDPYNIQEAEPNGKMPPIQSSSNSRKARSSERNYSNLDPLQHVRASAPIGGAPYNGTDMMSTYMAPLPPEEDSDPERVGPAMVFLPSHPTKKELSEIVAATKRGFALTGSAARRQVGPIIGLMDIGECEDSYLFRVSLPGVKRDESEFSCEVDTNGKVLIRGVTTTGRRRYAVTLRCSRCKLRTFVHLAIFPSHFSCLAQLIPISFLVTLALMVSLKELL